MALYLGGSEKLKISINNVAYLLNLFSTIPITNGIRLLSSDDYILKDSNELYVTTVAPIVLLTADNKILRESNGLRLVIKESE